MLINHSPAHGPKFPPGATALSKPGMPQQSTLISIDVYTDGACKGNPGPGGYGAILHCGEHRKELQGGRRQTTNNRMELLACVEALRVLKFACDVTIHSDSKYIVNAFSKGWAQRWRRNGWKRNKHDKAENADLWAELLALSDQHRVRFEWVRGHSGHPENERCDQLATTAAARDALPPDLAYEEQVERSKGWFD